MTVLAYPFKDAGFKYFIFLNNALNPWGEKYSPLERGERLKLCSSLMDNILSCAGQYALPGHDVYIGFALSKDVCEHSKSVVLLSERWES